MFYKGEIKQKLIGEYKAKTSNITEVKPVPVLTKFN
jgi:hypothetical protein